MKCRNNMSNDSVRIRLTCNRSRPCSASEPCYCGVCASSELDSMTTVVAVCMPHCMYNV